MEETGSLPGRTEVGSKIFSPFVDRFSLVLLSIIGVILAPELASAMEPSLGGKSLTAVVCGLIIAIPLIASAIGKLYVRIRASSDLSLALPDSTYPDTVCHGTMNRRPATAMMNKPAEITLPYFICNSRDSFTCPVHCVPSRIPTIEIIRSSKASAIAVVMATSETTTTSWIR